MRYLGLAALFLVPGLLNAQKDDLKSNVVEIDGFKSEAPKEWKRVKPANLLRAYQFNLPKADGDKEDGELSIRFDISGSDATNVARAQKMFIVPQGKTVADISKVEILKNGKIKLTYVEVAGTYLKKKRPIDPDFKAMKMPNYRMFNVLIETPDSTHVIRAVGPEKTITTHKKGFDAWLKNFKK